MKILLLFITMVSASFFMGCSSGNGSGTGYSPAQLEVIDAVNVFALKIRSKDHEAVMSVLPSNFEYIKEGVKLNYHSFRSAMKEFYETFELLNFEFENITPAVSDRDAIVNAQMIYSYVGSDKETTSKKESVIIILERNGRWGLSKVEGDSAGLIFPPAS